MYDTIQQKQRAAIQKNATTTTSTTIHAATTMTRPRQKAATGKQSWQDGNKDLDPNISSQLR